MRRIKDDGELRDVLFKHPSRGVGALVLQANNKIGWEGVREWDLIFPDDPDREEGQALWELSGRYTQTNPIWKCVQFRENQDEPQKMWDWIRVEPKNTEGTE